MRLQSEHLRCLLTNLVCVPHTCQTPRNAQGRDPVAESVIHSHHSLGYYCTVVLYGNFSCCAVAELTFSSEMYLFDAMNWSDPYEKLD